MPSASKSPRLWRLQFSLRGLLFLMTLAAVSLMVYRWPWQETKTLRPITGPEGPVIEVRTTTYRRSWNGKPLKHGRQYLVDQRQRLIHEAFYHDDERRLERRYQADGQLDSETSYPLPGKLELTRQFKTIGDETVIVERRIQLDLPRVSVVWRSASGVWLQSADYEAGVLIRWNGRPLEEAVADLLQDVSDDAVRTGWLADCRPDSTELLADLGDNTFRETCWVGRVVAADGQVIEPGEERSSVVLHIASCQPLSKLDVQSFFYQSGGWSYNLPGRLETRPHLPVLLKRLLAADYTFVVRYGVVCAVPINSKYLLQPDPTGVEQIHFAADSPAARDWQKLVPHIPANIRSHAQRIQHLFADTPLQLDTSRLTGENPAGDLFPESSPAPHLRSRRETLGLLLWYHHYRVEQQGNQLTVLPRSD